MRGFLPVLKKEALQMVRDRGTLRFALLIPAFQQIGRASCRERVYVLV